jgi:hypothetical protein
MPSLREYDAIDMVNDQVRTYKVSNNLCLINELVEKPRLYEIIRNMGYELLEGKAKKGKDLLEIMNFAID